ncbi:MAG TPA: NADH-quinone oxidoreductase subunit M [Candidatus Saccharimonadales bacterium]|jgi:NADH-quinone oxidoreductase subunit M|nr:NADH-quinone oxidoreductase subunit M [Candidatus Saccharimonadales bacterium]
MDLHTSILTIVTFLPAAGAVLLMVLPRNDRVIRWAALLISLLAFAFSLYLPAYFNSNAQDFQLQVTSQWIGQSIFYHLGVDGISMWLVLLTTFLVPLSVLISWKSIHDRVKEFFVLLLLLETAMIGVFLSLDLFLFYVFWEATLIPMALLIGMYGHERRIYAAVKFFLYTMVASVFMLAAIIWIYTQTHTFDYQAIRAMIAAGHLTAFTPAAMQWLFLGFFIAFAVKVPLFPFHTWLPDAHVEAPTAGSVLLAAVLLKMGTYGLLRFSVGLFPDQARHNATWINILAIIGIIYGALVALVQPNLKKLIAYSSVSHLGFVVLGIFTFTQAGADGAVYQMLNHGISTGALFMLAGMIYERKHTYELRRFGGLATPMPVYATFFLVAVLSSVGLPLLNGFVGEFLVLSGAAQSAPHGMIYATLATTGVIWSAAYLLWMYQKVFYGPMLHDDNKALPDLNGREQLSLWPLMAMALIMGVASPLWMKAIDPAVSQTLPAAGNATSTHSSAASLTGTPNGLQK